MTLTASEILVIQAEGRINECTDDEKSQVFKFFFGEDYMASDDKGSVKEYANENLEV